MIKKLNFLLCIIMLISCSEGDLIDISVEFDAPLQNCANENDNTFVFFKVDTEIDQALSVNFTSTTFTINPETVSDISLDEPIEIILNSSTNQFISRKFNTSIDGIQYFCSSIPPSNIDVIEELISSNGTVEISYQVADDSDPLETVYLRTISLRDITLVGDGMTLRRGILELGTELIRIPN